MSDASVQLIGITVASFILSILVSAKHIGMRGRDHCLVLILFIIGVVCEYALLFALIAGYAIMMQAMNNMNTDMISFLVAN